MPALLDSDEALARVLAAAGPVRPRRVSLSVALGGALAEEIRADRDYPPFDRAMMDGFAVRLSDAGRRVVVVGSRPAGSNATVALRGGEAVEIMTGAACPPGTEAIVPLEAVRRDGEHAVELPASLRAGAHVARRGAECVGGAPVLAAGTPVTPLAIAVLATFGRSEVLARPAPSVAIVTTGDELATGARALEPGRIRDSNGPMLEAMARLAGVRDLVRLHAADEDAALDAALARAGEADVIVLAGGVSAGRRDLVPAALERMGARTVFHGVSQKPGKPMLFATTPRQLVFGLPGNPLAVHLGFHRYVAPALRRCRGLDARPRAELARLATDLSHEDARTAFVLAHATRVEPGGFRVGVLAGAGSADLFTPAAANAYLRLAPGRTAMRAGDPVAIDWIGAERWVS